MRKVVLVLAAAIATFGQDRGERWRTDIQSLAEELPNRHPNLFTRVSRETFQEAANALAGSVHDVADHQLIAGLAKLAAMGGDGHTSLNLFQTGTGFRSYPVQLQWFPEGYYVAGAAPAYGAVLGKRLLRIGGVPMEQAYEIVKPYISYENESWARARSLSLLASPEVLHAAGVADSLDRVALVVEDAEGEREVMLQPGGSPLHPAPHRARPANPLYLRNPALFYWFEYLPDSRAVYMKYNVCGEAPLLPMADFIRQLAEFGLANPVERFIIDLRHNGGGSTAVIQPLLLLLRQAKAAGQPFRAYALIGRETFSSAVLNAIDMKRDGFLLIGEPTGGDPSGYGEVRSFTLPHSRLIVRHSTRKFNIPGYPGPQLSPDMPVELGAGDYFAERDPVLELALNQ